MASSSSSFCGSPEQPSLFKNAFHHGKSFKTLNTMRQQHVLCDVTVRVGDKEILGNSDVKLYFVLFVYKVVSWRTNKLPKNVQIFKTSNIIIIYYY